CRRAYLRRRQLYRPRRSRPRLGSSTHLRGGAKKTVLLGLKGMGDGPIRAVSNRVWDLVPANSDFRTWATKAADVLRANGQTILVPTVNGTPARLTADDFASAASRDVLGLKLKQLMGAGDDELTQDLLYTIDDLLVAAPKKKGTLRLEDDVWGTIID